MPLEVIGKHADEYVASNTVVLLVVDRPYLKLHGLETTEGLLDEGELFVRGHDLLFVESVGGSIRLDDVATVEEFLEMSSSRLLSYRRAAPLLPPSQ